MSCSQILSPNLLIRSRLDREKRTKFKVQAKMERVHLSRDYKRTTNKPSVPKTFPCFIVKSSENQEVPLPLCIEEEIEITSFTTSLRVFRSHSRGNWSRSYGQNPFRDLTPNFSHNIRSTRAMRNLCRRKNSAFSPLRVPRDVRKPK